MRTALTALAAAVLAALPTAAAAATDSAETPVPVPAAATTADPAAPVPQQGYSIPVGAITDLGALPLLANLGNDFARLLGQ
ncbi:hypothetical protein ACFV1L_08230 [Kitasatospora sp. NPDC059646]|uniref:hypothetical protein n=1 Tax=Kitasatospora sp. NPDC059646 TaxID=3346893 RepID=UPI0036A3373F